MIVIEEDFKDLDFGEYPYDHGHTALGEYHHLVYPGRHGNFYDSVPLHQWRSLDGSWLVTSDGKKRYMEQNRGDNTKDAFKNVYCCLVHKKSLFGGYTLSFDMRLFEFAHYAGMAFYYHTSRDLYAVGMKGDSLAILKRYEETIEVLDSVPFTPDMRHTYHFEVRTGEVTSVLLDGEKVLEARTGFHPDRKIALFAKSAARYSDITVSMNDKEYQMHVTGESRKEERILNKRMDYPVLKCIHKLSLEKYGTGRQIRIVRNGKDVLFLLAQHEKRMIRDSFAHLSCLTLMDYQGNVLWSIGEANNSPDFTRISCDLPFQVADINNDGRLEVICAQDFEVRILDLMTGKLLRSMPTPVIENDPDVKNEPFHQLNVDAIRVADFEGLGYKGDFIIKDRYQNVWAYDKDMKLLWRYHHKNTGHFPYIFDYDNDGHDEMLVGYDLIDHDGKMLWSLPMNSDHTDEIICAELLKGEGKKFILASGNEGMNLVNPDGTIYKHNEIGHAQRISVADYIPSMEGLEICATAFWGSDGIIAMYDAKGNKIRDIEMQSNGSVITPVAYDGKHVLILTHSDTDGGLLDGDLDVMVEFPEDGHPTLCAEAYDIDSDGIDEILVWDEKEMWVYKTSAVLSEPKTYEKYPDTGFSNYRGEYLIPKP